MARQESIFKVNGSLGDLSFYNSKFGYLVRRKGGASADRIKTEPSFQRTRENSMEFGNAARSAKVFRDTLHPMLQHVRDMTITPRCTGLMTSIKNMDKRSKRGERSVASGINEVGAKGLLKSFAFSSRSPLDSVLLMPCKVDSVGMQFGFSDLVTAQDIKFPQGATHVALQGAVAVIDFSTGFSDLVLSDAASCFIDCNPIDIRLFAPAPPSGTGVRLYLLSVVFFQEVNGVQYSFKNGAYNALGIVDVAS